MVLAPTGTLRAVYLDGNPVQAVKYPSTGEVKGVAADIARAMGEAADVPVNLQGLQGIPDVIDAVASGEADISFLAPDPTREGKVRLSEIYLRNPQSLVVSPSSKIASIDDLKKPGIKIGVTKGDSIANYLEWNYSNVTLIAINGASAKEAAELLREGEVDGFAANIVRLKRIGEEDKSLGVIPGSITGVPQAIVVPSDNDRRLQYVNDFITSERKSGNLQSWIAAADNGTVVAP
ncbi:MULTISPECIES: transporter substrate-binding domain-containing protein [Rhizobium/Agrobacterium group]|uniref:transporter substrate-binding domain-containing protein n=1 Tax=Rhizobium/Agrobacterium group TaxID=227290 RepID=UPI001ADAB645|nr:MULTISPECIES: transporter substrate-binding domain-containing protein [Rhizobium/Agrobacterium group]MBO9112674.1 transporter substrate-binding domain-containing protein [Agrobacterium sp. S2/73]QXZ76164.1 transporter substrate-binding domain-containing protein [Agrobacterium sp. S7/73]QYA17287.1 transporter substrate-binding domain-containing protein [Rhizobium sp. AB2/73]UEQ85596.1 transporter substrate-binding domain-containing protein [Rhizobium sp. AB2/73]